MLSHSQLPTSYWSYAISTVVHIVNRLPTPNLQNLSPQELLFIPDLISNTLGLLGVTISLYWDPTTLINFNHIPHLAFFLATLHTQRVIFAWILLPLGFTFQEMFCSMKLISYLLSLYPLVQVMSLLVSHNPQNLICISFLLLFNFIHLPHLP